MKVKIEDYRGWEIFFHTDNEEFYTVSNEYDKDKSKKSYAATKKFIDDYIKDNLEFKPVFAQTDASIFSGGEIIKLVGIRKDGFFMCERNGKIEQLGKYYEKDYYLVNEENNAAMDVIKELRKERDGIDLKIKEVNKKVIRIGLDTIREKYIPKETK